MFVFFNLESLVESCKAYAPGQLVAFNGFSCFKAKTGTCIGEFNQSLTIPGMYQVRTVLGTEA